MPFTPQSAAIRGCSRSRVTRRRVSTKARPICATSDLLTVNFDKVSQVDLTAKKQNIEFGRSKDAWQIVKPRPLRADNFSVEDLVRKLKDAKMDLTASADSDEKKIAAAFASATPVATAKVTDATGHANSGSSQGENRLLREIERGCRRVQSRDAISARASINRSTIFATRSCSISDSTT